MSRVHTYSGPFMHGLGDSGICLDADENPIPCQDPGCALGPCGTVSTGPLPTGACLDEFGNATMCMDPGCTYGDCLPSSSPARVSRPGTVSTPGGILTPAGGLNLPSRPGNVINVPLNTGTFGMWLGNSTIPGLPNWALITGTLLVAALFLGGKHR